MRTLDDFHVSSMSQMCAQHVETFGNLAASVMDDGAEYATDAYKVAWIGKYLAEGRAECIDGCGRA